MTGYDNETNINTMRGCGMHILGPVIKLLFPYKVGDHPVTTSFSRKVML
jgi:hypothetical protein